MSAGTANRQLGAQIPSTGVPERIGGRFVGSAMHRSVLLIVAALAACGEPAAPDAPASEADLANAAALANEAAADEAADMSNFGGNAAAIDAPPP